MKKFLAITIFIAAASAVFYTTGCKGGKNEPKTTKEDTQKKSIERGEYLANYVAGCMDCHSQRDFSKYSGPVVPGTEGGGGLLFDHKWGLPGALYSKNITPDNETGIGSWTDDEILKALTQGISKNGDTLFPLMPYVNYNRMAKQDLVDIIAYIRTLKPIKNKVQERKLMVPIDMVYPAQYLQASVDTNVKPAPSDLVNYGRYLVTFADCGTCHSPLTPEGPDLSRMFAGGYKFDLGATGIVVSANITSDSATGIGAWTEERFLNKFTQYREEKNYNFDPGKQNTIMPVTLIGNMKDEDLKAIYAFLRTVKPISNKVEKYPVR